VAVEVTLLTPVTLRNHAGDCARPPLPATGNAVSAEADYRTRMLKASAESYLDVRERPFLHLVDGGLADNLGMRGLLDRLVATGSIRDSFRDVAPGSIRKLILIAVNSERDLAERIDQSDQVPTTGQVMDALLFGAGSRVTQMTLAMLDDDLRRWSQELTPSRRAGSRSRRTPSSTSSASACATWRIRSGGARPCRCPRPSRSSRRTSSCCRMPGARRCAARRRSSACGKASPGRRHAATIRPRRRVRPGCIDHPSPR
jgi:hypothetical protein